MSPKNFFVAKIRIFLQQKCSFNKFVCNKFVVCKFVGNAYKKVVPYMF